MEKIVATESLETFIFLSLWALQKCTAGYEELKDCDLSFQLKFSKLRKLTLSTPVILCKHLFLFLPTDFAFTEILCTKPNNPVQLA